MNREEKQLEVEKQLELEKIWQNTEKMKLELEQSKLQLIWEGTFPPGQSSTEDSASISFASGSVDVIAKLRLVS